MNGDFTRLSFRPKKHYSGVLMQQGRVQMDSDWNELVQIIEHRIEQQAIDTIGACGVPKPPSGQPAPFTVTAQDDGSLQLEPGRIYVDGLLCELEPDAVQNWPTVSLAGPARSVTVLVYLDAWQRHVSAIEDKSLRESALGGPDTATRLQTAWALRVNAKPTPSRNCDSATDLPTASTGTLTTHQAASTTTTPCVVGTRGGYTGLENRLYRVEIHRADSGGQPAAFKWSRDNNSIGLAVSDFPTNDSVTVTQLGRDDVTRFLHHWVEVIGDQSESTHGAGSLAQVLAIDQVDGILKLDRDVSSYQAEDNPRIRRWDMPFVAPIAGGSPPEGAILITPGPTTAPLDPSVAVSFDVPGAATGPHFKVGDFWTFTARTAEGLLETLTNAPPQGIQHHYCKLAWVTWTIHGEVVLVSVVPCSHTFPPLTDLPTGDVGTCIQLAPGPVLGQRLQKAVESLRPFGGGCICLPPGIQVLEMPIKIDVARTTISGCNGTSRLVFLPAAGVSDPAITLSKADGAILKDFGLFALGANALISVQDSAEVRLDDCQLVNLPAGDSPSLCILTNDVVPGLAIRNCDLVGGSGLVALSDTGDGGVRPQGLGHVAVERCRIRARQVGAYLEMPDNFTFDGNDVAGFTASDWATLTPSSLSQSNVPIIEKIIDDRLHSPWVTDFPSDGYLLPLGLAVFFPSVCSISRCMIRAAIGIVALEATTANISTNRIAGLVGACLALGNKDVTIEGNQITTDLYGCLAAGDTNLQWQIRQNLVSSRDAIVIGPIYLAGYLISACFRAMFLGLDQFRIDRDAITLEGISFEPGPTNWAGRWRFPDDLQGRYLDYLWIWRGLVGNSLSDFGLAGDFAVDGNVLHPKELGVSLEGGVFTVGDISITGNTIGEISNPTCNLAGVRMQSWNWDTGYLHQVQGNRVHVTGVGISVDTAGTTVSDNLIVLTGRQDRPSNLRSLELIPAILNWSFDLTEPWGVSNASTVRTLLDQVIAAFGRGQGLTSQQLQALQTTVLLPFSETLRYAGWTQEAKLVTDCLAALAKAQPDFATAYFRLKAAAELFVSGIDDVGIRLAGDLLAATGNTIQGRPLARGGILIDPPPMPDRIEVRDNRILSGLGHGVEIRTTSYNLRITGNTVQQFAGNGIGFIGYSLQAADVEISDNQIAGCRHASQLSFPAIEAAGILVYGAWDARLLNNVVESCGDPKYPSPVFGMVVSDTVNITASGNRVANNGGSGGSDNDRCDGAGIYLPRCMGPVLVEGNRLQDNQTRAMTILATGDAGPIAMIGNVIMGSKAPGTLFGTSVRIICPVADVTLSGNQITYISAVVDYAVSLTAQRAVIADNMWNEQNRALPIAFWLDHYTAVGNITRNYTFLPIDTSSKSAGHNTYA